MNEAVVQRVRRVAQAILDGLGDGAPRWTLLDVGHATANPAPEAVDLALSSWHSGPLPHLTGPDPEAQLTVVVGPADRSAGESVAAYYSLRLPEADAVTELASQLQDHAVESVDARGQALPPCPGHSHPLRARVVDGAPVWQCPTSPEHHRVLIIGENPPES